MNQIVVNEPNRWRLQTPGATGWPRSPRPDAAKKYFDPKRYVEVMLFPEKKQ